MYKYAKVKETENKDIDQSIVYAEKSGLYCDLCGDLIHEGSARDYPTISHYTGSKYYTIGTGCNLRDSTGRIPINTIIPTIRIHSLVADREIDICPKCESDILRKISINSGKIMENLLETSRYEILSFQENMRKDQEDIRNLRTELGYLQDAISAIDNKYE